MHRITMTAVVLAAVVPAATASAQQTTATRGTTTANVNQCVASATIQQYSDGDVTITRSKTTGNVYVRDTTAKEVRANVGGGSVPLSSTNMTRTATVESVAKVVVTDTTKRYLPRLNSERTAVRVNVGGGSIPLTRVNASNTSIVDATKVRPMSCPTPDVPSTRKL